jgi:hypothetical protein
LDLRLLSGHQLLHILVLLLNDIEACLELLILLSGLMLRRIDLSLEVVHSVICSSKGDCYCQGRVQAVVDASDDIVLICLSCFSVQSIFPRDIFPDVHFRLVIEAVLHAVRLYQGLDPSGITDSFSSGSLVPLVVSAPEVLQSPDIWEENML